MLSGRFAFLPSGVLTSSAAHFIMNLNRYSLCLPHLFRCSSMVERLPVKEMAVGSSPTTGAKRKRKLFCRLLLLTEQGGGAGLYIFARARRNSPHTRSAELTAEAPFRHVLAGTDGIFGGAIFSCPCPTLSVRGQVVGTPYNKLTKRIIFHTIIIPR